LIDMGAPVREADPGLDGATIGGPLLGEQIPPRPARPPRDEIIARLRRLPIAAGAVAAALCLVVLFGWATDFPAARSLGVDEVPMQPSGAICLLLLAVSAGALAAGASPLAGRVATCCAAPAFLGGALALIEYGYDVDLHVDRLFYPGEVVTVSPEAAGRMALGSALTIVLDAAAVLVLNGRGHRATLASQALTLAAGVTGMTALYSQVYHYSFVSEVEPGRPWATVAGSAAAIVLAFGTLTVRPEHGIPRLLTDGGVGSVMARWMLGAGVTVPFLLGWVPILIQGGGRYGSLSIALLITCNAVAFGWVSFVAASAVGRMQAASLRAEENAREGHNQLLALIDNTSAVIYMRDLDGRYVLVNREYERLFEVKREDLLGKTDHDLFPVEVADAFRANDLAAVARGFPVQMEETAPGDDGPHNYITVKFPLIDSAGRAYAVCGISTDITARTRAEAEVRRLNSELEMRVRERTAELEASTRELDAFSYSVSHDLRTPLRSLDGFSQVLLEDYADVLDDTGKDYLRRLQANTGRMAQTIDDLLDLSRATRVDLNRSEVDVSAIARAVVAELREADPAREVEVVVAEDLRSLGDPHLVRLVMDNLLGNAWKFTGKAAHAVIEVGALDKDGERVFTVRDNGAGFNMEYGEKLFEPFQRLHTRGEFDGSGLGLAIVARIVRRHGGRIWAESEPGRGAAFFFTLIPSLEDERS
jgi:PAS domain S-box-containing protein